MDYLESNEQKDSHHRSDHDLSSATYPLSELRCIAIEDGPSLGVEQGKEGVKAPHIYRADARFSLRSSSRREFSDEDLNALCEN